MFGIYRSLILVVGLLATCSVLASIEYPRVVANVSYTSVAKLPFQDADHKIPYGNNPLQYGLFWEPQAQRKNQKNNSAKPPLIILIHGGCWLNAYDIKHTLPLSTALSQAGYPVWSLEYRRTGDNGGGWPGTFNDIVAGIKAAESLSSYGLEASSIVIMGHSAGGHLALLAGAKWNKQPLLKLPLSRVIGLAAITDIQAYATGSNDCQTATPEFMGGAYTDKKRAYDAANPVKRTLPSQTVVMHGTQDMIVPIEQANMLDANKIVIQDAGHFDWVHPGSEAFYALLAVLRKE